MIFHKQVGFPEQLIIPRKFLFLKYSKHALRRFKERVNKRPPSINKMMLTKKKFVEVKTTESGKKILMCVVRIQHNKSYDIVLVLKPNFKKATAKVITLWINHKKDHHMINKSNYSKP